MRDGLDVREERRERDVQVHADREGTPGGGEGDEELGKAGEKLSNKVTAGERTSALCGWWDGVERVRFDSGALRSEERRLLTPLKRP